MIPECSCASHTGFVSVLWEWFQNVAVSVLQGSCAVRNIPEYCCRSLIGFLSALWDIIPRCCCLSFTRFVSALWHHPRLSLCRSHMCVCTVRFKHIKTNKQINKTTTTTTKQQQQKTKQKQTHTLILIRQNKTYAHFQGKPLFNPFITSSACKVYTWKPAVQKHTAVQNQLCRSATLQITTYLL